MIVEIEPCVPAGKIAAPPSKSMAHRYLIGAALCGQECTLSGLDFSEDILATIDCLQALGANITIDADAVRIDPQHFMSGAGFRQSEDIVEAPVLECRESGSTLRFFIPLALCLGVPVTLRGSARLFERPLGVYEDLCRARGFTFHKETDSVTVRGRLQSGAYELEGGVSSQFVTGLIFALVYLGGDSLLRILPPFESRSYVDLTIRALRSFGACVALNDEHTISIRSAQMRAFSGKIEGDYSNAAFLDAFNELGSSVTVMNLDPSSAQGDRVYRKYFSQISAGVPTLDISDCPDLGPILFALAAMKNGAVFTGTDRLKAKESDRGRAMDSELRKLGGGLIFGENSITVPKQDLRSSEVSLSSHNDHRIAMALAVILSRIGGSIEGAESVRKSYPRFFDDLRMLGAKVKKIC